jgi:hypothetical protein
VDLAVACSTELALARGDLEVAVSGIANAFKATFVPAVFDPAWMQHGIINVPATLAGEYPLVPTALPATRWVGETSVLRFLPDAPPTVEMMTEAALRAFIEKSAPPAAPILILGDPTPPHLSNFMPPIPWIEPFSRTAGSKFPMSLDSLELLLHIARPDLQRYIQTLGSSNEAPGMRALAEALRHVGVLCAIPTTALDAPRPEGSAIHSDLGEATVIYPYSRLWYHGALSAAAPHVAAIAKWIRLGVIDSEWMGADKRVTLCLAPFIAIPPSAAVESMIDNIRALDATHDAVRGRPTLRWENVPDTKNSKQALGQLGQPVPIAGWTAAPAYVADIVTVRLHSPGAASEPIHVRSTSSSEAPRPLWAAKQNAIVAYALPGTAAAVTIPSMPLPPAFLVVRR